MVPSIKHGGGGMIMWGKGLDLLIKVNEKINYYDYIQILESHLLPLINNNFNGKGYLFQDDNTPVHTAKNVKKWIETKKSKFWKLAKSIIQLEPNRTFVIRTRKAH
ncbi:hypothetical protein RhiirA4_511087 [Rhizophagus irregularis]|uniref:Transposable element tc3 transposase n=1 Tax=Rhizophagus irregularis TaxID=588596 RepID=A0A2I1HGC3_9GLOM|nr:hypothetical protein RhiirA4_511087 [Rhizophagus irregularis]